MLVAFLLTEICEFSSAFSFQPPPRERGEEAFWQMLSCITSRSSLVIPGNLPAQVWPKTESLKLLLPFAEQKRKFLFP